ncbi:hypothetical protein Tco_1483825 [Tanacetum coccineum]
MKERKSGIIRARYWGKRDRKIGRLLTGRQGEMAGERTETSKNSGDEGNENDEGRKRTGVGRGKRGKSGGDGGREWNSKDEGGNRPRGGSGESGDWCREMRGERRRGKDRADEKNAEGGWNGRRKRANPKKGLELGREGKERRDRGGGGRDGTNDGSGEDDKKNERRLFEEKRRNGRAGGVAERNRGGMNWDVGRKRKRTIQSTIKVQ